LSLGLGLLLLVLALGLGKQLSLNLLRLDGLGLRVVSYDEGSSRTWGNIPEYASSQAAKAASERLGSEADFVAVHSERKEWG